MATLRILIALEYDAALMHGGDEDLEAKDWFFDEVLALGSKRGELILHSNGDLGDDIGTVRIIQMESGQ